MKRAIQWLLAAIRGIPFYGLALQGLAGEAPSLREVAIMPDDRLLVLAPHPDDEVIGCGGIIQRAKAADRPVRVVFLTYGDNNQWSFAVYRKHPVIFPPAVRRMGEIRRAEALNAGQALGLEQRDLLFLGYPDFGTLSIWLRHWGTEAPFHSLLTKVSSVPYVDAFRPGAPYKGEAVLRDLKGIIREFRPTKVLVSHPADHNPDHQALYLFTVVALWDLAEDVRPTLMPYLVHYRNWPDPKGYLNGLPAAPPQAMAQMVSWMTFPLQPAEIERKRTALERHKTQFEYSGKHLLSFVKRTELFGDFPPIAFVPSAVMNGVEVDRAKDAASAEEHRFLTDEERAVYVGVERRSLRLSEGSLEIGISFSRALMETTSISISAFGYRHDRPFAEMPKIHVEIGAVSHGLFDQSRPLPVVACSVSRTRRESIIRIPLSLLGEPERILTSARTYAAEIPLDWVAWRVLHVASQVEKQKQGANAPDTPIRAP